MELKNKTILIISPQQWDGLKLSKHHYAEELVKLGNKVYFLPPPIKNKQFCSINKLNNGVLLIKYAHFFPYNLFFHAKWLYFILLKLHVKYILKHLDKIDIVWSFDGLRFLNLNLFKATHKIYHPVDFQDDNYFIKPAKTSDIIISLTDKILDKFVSFKNVHKIGHGVSELFLDAFNSNYKPNNQLSFCYSGNLTLKGVNIKEIKKVIEKARHIKFHFIGPYSEDNEAEKEYISFLKSQSNVKLYGLLTPMQMKEIYVNMDGFILCYDEKKELNGGTNSHKILEYLSTGKVIISSFIAEYQHHTDLLEMSKGKESFSEVFMDRISKINFYNSPEKINLRHNYAKNNTYRKQILKIEKLLN